jgi:hypothetical protein
MMCLVCQAARCNVRLHKRDTNNFVDELNNILQNLRRFCDCSQCGQYHWLVIKLASKLACNAMNSTEAEPTALQTNFRAESHDR